MRNHDRLKLSRQLRRLTADVLDVRSACDDIGQQACTEAAIYRKAIAHLAAGVTGLNELAAERVELNTAPAGGNDGSVDISEL